MASEQAARPSRLLWPGGGSLGDLGTVRPSAWLRKYGSHKARGDTDLSLETVTCVTRFRLDWSVQVWIERASTEKNLQELWMGLSLRLKSPQDLLYSLPRKVPSVSGCQSPRH